MGFFPVKCSLGLGFYDQTLGTTLLPLVVVLLFCLLEACHLTAQRVPLRSMLPNVVKCLVFVMFLC